MISQVMFSDRRKRLTEKLPHSSLVIILSAQIVSRNADVDYPFRQDSNFWYLTGFDEPKAVFILRKDHVGTIDEFLYVQGKNKETEIWTGYIAGKEEAKRVTGITNARDWGDFENNLPKLSAGISTCYFDIDGASYRELRQRITQVLSNNSRRSVSENLTTIIKTNSLLRELRMYKDQAEIAAMQVANDVAIVAHKHAVQSMRRRIVNKESVYEYQIEADLYHQFRHHALQWSYPAIVASGKNACILHYTQNTAQLQQGELVLIDAGCEAHYYASDITRCYPVSGVFSSAQKQIYELVLKAQLASIDHIDSDGATYQSFHDVSVEVLIRGLIDLGLLTGSLEENLVSGEYRKYYMHGVGHHIGLDVHDVGVYLTAEGKRSDIPLLSGMAVTVEPGLYFDIHDESIPLEFRGIGIRIEDDIIKTASSVINLTEALPKTVSEIEDLCNV